MTLGIRSPREAAVSQALSTKNNSLSVLSATIPLQPNVLQANYSQVSSIQVLKLLTTGKILFISTTKVWLDSVTSD